MLYLPATYVNGWRYLESIQRGTTLTDEKRLSVKTQSCVNSAVQLNNQGFVSCLLVCGCCRRFRCGGIRSLASFPAIAVIESEQLLRAGALIIRGKQITKLCLIRRTVWVKPIIKTCEAQPQYSKPIVFLRRTSMPGCQL